MSGDLRDLYQELILDHQRRPRNFRVLGGADRWCDGHNPLCGDRVTVYLKLEGDVVTDASFQGTGCAISTASASMMTEKIKGKSRGQIERLFRSFHALLTQNGKPPHDGQDLGKLQVFAGVRQFPIRIKCATLPWHALRAALEGRQEQVSTE